MRPPRRLWPLALCVIALCGSLLIDSPTRAQTTCSDGIKNGDETDVDCGGARPPRADGKLCTIDSDCRTGYECYGTCGCFSNCPVGAPCGNNTECVSGLCVGGF